MLVVVLSVVGLAIAAVAYAMVRRRFASLRREVRECCDQKTRVLARLVASAEYAVASSNTEGVITSWSPGAERIFGYAAEEVLGRNASMFFRPEDQGELGPLLERAAREGHVAVELRNVRKDGATIWVSDDLSPVRDARGALVGYSAIVRDVTERKRLEEELKRRMEDLARSNRDLEQFAAAASHDLQAPLRKIASFASLFKARYGGRLDAEADLYFEVMAKSAAQLGALIADLLAYARVGREKPDFQRFPLREAVDEALANLDAAIKDSGARVTVEALPEVVGDPAQLERLFQNLIDNAIKYRGREAPLVAVRAADGPRESVVSVSDNGCGFAPERAAEIFAPFVRLHSAAECPGTGIGLAICQRVVELHGGRIWAESEPGRGSTFRFSIPLAPAR